MRTLHLTIRKEHLDAILSGEKKQYAKEIRPTTKSRYCEFSSEGALDVPRHFDALKLGVGQMDNKDWLEIEVTGIVIKDDMVVYYLGEILSKKISGKVEVLNDCLS